MSETQIYKWWWDQTRKRMKRLKNAAGSQLNEQINPMKGKKRAKFEEITDQKVSKKEKNQAEVMKKNKKIEKLDQISDQK